MCVLRSTLDVSGKPSGTVRGKISGWLPVEVADFVSDHSGLPAALWHVVYDDANVGEEDLEEF
eukprot:CAMPEP_0206216516 /NCGR_PEP_ID=MMETSP0047_2-20121206/2762_1 /ASSEMBLY_ACC=CAM_ASM_000192 /TAXON_ID=195065 /ORGANISM="Chroomonas mesostigmatica_cf, Strain CCMP1168" /LENGTH=62 /DNA_ID=CAMNT_0053638867 /DNA_START=82 /DNA_END=267 /DNA_ORIENTATION=-